MIILSDYYSENNLRYRPSLSADEKFLLALKTLEEGVNDLKLIANGIDSGLSLIGDQLKHTTLTNEYYLVFGRLLELKEKHPDLKFEIKMDIENSRFALTEQMRIALAWLFTEVPKLKDVFNRECVIGECPANEWFGFMLRNADLSATFYYDKTSKRDIITGDVQVCYRNIYFSKIDCSWFKANDIYSCKRRIEIEEESFKKFIAILYNKYGKKNMANYCTIVDGMQYITTWLAERYCETMITTLKNIYSNAVIELLNR